MHSLVRLWWALVQFGFRLLYNELAFTYDLVSWIVSLGQWRCWQRASLKHLDVNGGDCVLELAHGTGNLQLDFHKAGIQSIGLDFSPHMGRIAQKKLRKAGIQTPLIRATGLQLPFAAQSFKAVISTFPTPFIFESETLQEINRVLKPDGMLIIVINGQFNGTGIIQRFLEWLYRITGQRAESPEDIAAVEIMSRFSHAGLSAEFIKESCKNSFAQLIISRK